MRTTQGYESVDVIYRRVDDDFLDPLTFRPDSCLGVAGIMDVYRAGNVTIANAPGTGISDDKAIYSYMPEIVEFYTGRKAMLENVPTWRCSEPDSFKYVMEHLPELVSRKSMVRAATACWSAHSDAQGNCALRRKAQSQAGQLHRPADAVVVDRSDHGQERHRAPTCPISGLMCWCPTRCISSPAVDPRRAQERLAGGQFQPGRRHERHLGAGGLIDDARKNRKRPVLDVPLSGTRRKHRPPHRRRLRMSLTRSTESEDDWDGVLQSAGVRELYAAKYEKLSGADAMDFLMRDKTNPSSVINCLEFAATTPAWCAPAHPRSLGKHQRNLARTEDRARQESDARHASRRDRRHQAPGCAYARGLLRHAVARRTLQLRHARLLHRTADNTARILDVKYYVLLPSLLHVGGSMDNFHWQSILRSVSAFRSYSWVYDAEYKPANIAHFLILNRRMPRSLAFCYEQIASNLAHLARDYGNQVAAHDTAARTRNMLLTTSIDEIMDKGCTSSSKTSSCPTTRSPARSATATGSISELRHAPENQPHDGIQL